MAEPSTDDQPQKQDEEVIDFSKIGAKIKNFFEKRNTGKPSQQSHEHHQTTSEDVSVDFREAASFFKRHARWIIPLLCILLAMSVSIYLRTMPIRLPITDDIAQNNVYNFYHNQLEAQINQQYPNLPDANRKALIEAEFQKALTENEGLINSQIIDLSRQYKNQYRDDQGTPYLLGIDPYYYYRQSEYIVKNGYPGSGLNNGVPWDYYRLAPLGREAEWNFHSWFGAQLYNVVSFFSDASLMAVFFYVGTIFAALSVIPAFFIGKIISRNNIGGFFTAMLVAVSAFYVARTTGESSDTDVHAVFWPLLITWLFLQALETNIPKKRIIWLCAAGFATGLFAFAWTGWWYIASFILAASIVHFGTHLWNHRSELKQNAWKIASSPLLTLGVYLITAMLSVVAFTSLHQVRRIFIGGFQFLQLKAVAVTTYWPNIRTTVAELNVVDMNRVMEQLGGELLFALAMFGIILTLTRKSNEQEWDPSITFFLALWMAASLFATTKGVRFILQITPVFALALGAFMGIAWQFASAWISKQLKIAELITKVVLFIILALILIQPVQDGYSQAFNSLSSMNDGWYNVLSKIKKESPENTIITSWWDFGHWFKAIADRPVTFDGGTQLGHGAYWVGKSLLTSDEKLSMGIVRMLNCGQNSAFDQLDAILNDTPRSVELLSKIIIQDKNKAIKILQDHGLNKEQIASIIQFTHCDNPPPDYYITSEDMVGKAGVWGHFGSWDFRKAVAYQKAKNWELPEGASFLQDYFQQSEEQASEMYSTIQSTDADRWIASWPGYINGPQRCDAIEQNKIRCSGALQGQNFALLVDTNTFEVEFQGNPEITFNSVVHPTRNGIVEKEPAGKKIGVSLVLIPQGEGYYFMITDPLQANSMFTKLFFLEGHGLQCFQKFDDTKSLGGGRIITWIVDYTCQQDNAVFFLPTEEVRASHILISTQSRSEEEARTLAETIKQEISPDNFADLAQQYSEDPGSKAQGGDLGWFGKGEMVPEFETAAFSLDKGEISGLVKTQFGYHLIYVTDKRTQ